MTLTREQISLLAHADHPIACPFDDARVGDLLHRLWLEPGARVVDVGCGTGEWLVRLAEARPDVESVGIERSALAVERAREALRGRKAKVQRSEAAAHFPGPEQFDAALCVGSTHALGGFAAALPLLRDAVRPGGVLLVGEGFWESAPTAAALGALECEAGDFQGLEGTIAAAEGHGLTLEYAAISSPREWDDYEFSWCGALERHAVLEGSLGESEVAELRAASRAHREAYLKGYRGVLGFMGLVLRRPAAG